MKAACMGCSSPPGASPSIVVTSWPSQVTASVRQASTRLPSTHTVQAPQVPWSQPFFDPVRSRCSRSRSSRLTRASTSANRVSPLTSISMLASIRPCAPPLDTAARSIRSLRLSVAEVAVDPGEDREHVDALRVGDALAVGVRDVRVDRQHGVRPAEQIGAAGVAEAGAAVVLRVADELVRVGVAAGHELGCRAHSRPGAGPAGARHGLVEELAGQLDLVLDAIADVIDAGAVREGVHEARSGQLREPARQGRALDGVIELHDSDVVDDLLLHPRAALEAVVRVRVRRTAGVTEARVAVESGHVIRAGAVE